MRNSYHFVVLQTEFEFSSSFVSLMVEGKRRRIHGSAEETLYAGPEGGNLARIRLRAQGGIGCV
jgi:hypothetical protein